MITLIECNDRMQFFVPCVADTFAAKSKAGNTASQPINTRNVGQQHNS